MILAEVTAYKVPVVTSTYPVKVFCEELPENSKLRGGAHETVVPFVERTYPEIGCEPGIEIDETFRVVILAFVAKRFWDDKALLA